MENRAVNLNLGVRGRAFLEEHPRYLLRASVAEELAGRLLPVGVAVAAAGDENLVSKSRGVIKHQDGPAALPALDGAHEPGRAAAQDNDVVVLLRWFFFSHEGIVQNSERGGTGKLEGECCC